MAAKESKIMERAGFIIMILSTFSGVILYGEGRLETIEKSARGDLRVETQQRREDIREVNQKLDRIIDILTRVRR